MRRICGQNSRVVEEREEKVAMAKEGKGIEGLKGVLSCWATWASKKWQLEQLKEEVRTELHATAKNPSQQLQLIDVIQRLGVEYHFQEEIGQALRKMHEKHQNWEDIDHIYTAALYFRILRQEGFRVSSDSALAFSSNHLQSLPNKLNSPLDELVSHALMQPNWRGLPRLEARNYISVYEKDHSHKTTLLKLAKLDFNMLQSLHKEELHEISLWWKELDFARKLPFARDRIVVDYLWIVGVYFEPQYGLPRKILSKVIAMASVIDDVYDVYGTYKELEIFTEAIERWDVGCIKQLPDYMKICYQTLLDVFEEIEQAMVKTGRSYQSYYAKEAMKMLIRAYFAEAKWLGMAMGAGSFV
ncbi:(-)-germacrene D synthase-like [Coffea eugenioides]|uniref:(-)-germacrene D synthase-like n=1 Tax=Coffea eugenioides TaxID=49369 RepID=UPI000F6087F7|nr:(-)-germacrene D synthase-like [Coffea eugenioides]